MTNSKLVSKRMALLSLTLLVLLALSSINPALGIADGLSASASNEGKAFLRGTVKKDIKDFDAIFKGDYGASSTFTLGDNATGLGEFTLQNGELQTYGDSTTGYGSITVDPSEILHADYNSSGLLDISDWTETDTGAVLGVTIDTAGSLVDAPPSMRLYSSETNANTKATLVYTPTSGISMEKYFIFGAKINTESTNLSESVWIQLFEQTNGNNFQLRLTEASSDFASSGSGTSERVAFDDDADDVIFVQVKLSDLDGWDNTFTMTSINEIKIVLNPNTAAFEGTFSMDIFAFDFIDYPAKLGLDRNDQITTANDYVALNITDPSSPDLSVREVDSDVTSMILADIDFISEVSTDGSPVYDDVNFRVTHEYEMNLKTSTAWQDEVTLSSMTFIHVLDRDFEDYASYLVNDVDSQSSIISETAGDAITIASSVTEDTVYRLKYQLTLSEEDYDIAVALAGQPTNTINSAEDWILGLLSAITLFGIGTWSKKKRRSKRTGRANK